MLFGVFWQNLTKCGKTEIEYRINLRTYCIHGFEVESALGFGSDHPSSPRRRGTSICSVLTVVAPGVLPVKLIQVRHRQGDLSPPARVRMYVQVLQNNSNRNIKAHSHKIFTKDMIKGYRTASTDTSGCLVHRLTLPLFKKHLSKMR